ncbi:MAG: hypothetical protein ACO1N3_00095 [Gammaproteobacteria bacterium]
MFLTPISLSALAMVPVLPKQFVKFIKQETFYPLAQENLREILLQRTKKFLLVFNVEMNQNDIIIFNKKYERLNTTQRRRHRKIRITRKATKFALCDFLSR